MISKSPKITQDAKDTSGQLLPLHEKGLEKHVLRCLLVGIDQDGLNIPFSLTEL